MNYEPTIREILLLVASGTSFIMGLFMIFLYYYIPKIKGPVFWAICSFLVGLGLLFEPIFSGNIFLEKGVPNILISFGL
jgi:hypothetical protein